MIIFPVTSIVFPSLTFFNKRKKLFYPPEKFKIDNFACKSGRVRGGREGMGNKNKRVKAPRRGERRQKQIY